MLPRRIQAMEMDIRESQNYLRLHILVNGVGSKILRQVFKRRFQVVKKTEWEDSSTFAKEFLRTYSNSKKVLPIQWGMIKTADLNKFDMTLLSSLIQHVDSVSPGGLEGMDNTRSENASVQEIVDVRNTISHLPGRSVDMKLFEELWGKIKPALINLGVEEETIEEIRSASELDGISFRSGKTVEEEAEELKNAIEAGDLSMQNVDYVKAIRNYSVALSRKCLSVEEKISVLSKRSDAFIQCLLQDNNLLPDDQIDENCKLALEDAEEIIKTDPELWKGHFLAGQVHKLKRDWKLAIDCLDRALAWNPGLTEVLNHRSECRHELSKTKLMEHMNPQSVNLGIQHKLDQLQEHYGFALKADAVIKKHEAMLTSEDPKIRAEACLFFGNLHEHGVDLPQDYSKAAKYYGDAADEGQVRAMCQLGALYIQGRGVPKDIAKGIELVEKAAKSRPQKDLESCSDFDEHVAYAQHCLAIYYEEGVGKPQDFVKAAEWYSKGSKNGSGMAAHNLGILYLDGRGVPQSRQKAMQYLRLAAGRGMEISMDMVAWMYLSENKAEVAEGWYKQALEKGNLLSILRKDDFYKILAAARLAEHETKRTRDNPDANDTRAKIGVLKMYSGASAWDSDELEMHSAFSDSKNFSGVDILHNGDIEKSLTWKIWTQKQEISARALAGHAFAQELSLSMFYFVKAFDLLSKMETSNVADKALQQEMLENMANCLRLREIVVASSPGLNEVLRSISYANMSKGKEKSRIDLNARVCYCWILFLGQGEEIFPFLEVCRKKYPAEMVFYTYHAGKLVGKGKFREALRITNEAVEMFPNVSDFLYEKASCMRMLTSDTDEYKYEDIIAAYQEFIAVAPFDDRNIPDAYYSMAYLTISYGKHIPNYSGVMESYYNQGLEAEQRILPCFLPYDEESPAKRICEAKINKKSKKMSDTKISIDSKTVKEPAKGKSNPQGNETNHQVTHPLRVQSVVRHRKVFRKMDAIPAILRGRSSVEPKIKQKNLRSVANLEEITFSEMIPTKDHVYEGKLLNLTITEDPMVGMLAAIHVIAKDKNDDNLNICFYKMDHQAAKTNLSFGSQISIINPYFRIGQDNTLGIRVDDPQRVIFPPDAKKSICRYCWKENPKFSCAKCGRAKYCSRECQNQDWKVLKHKYICKLKCFEEGITE